MPQRLLPLAAGLMLLVPPSLAQTRSIFDLSRGRAQRATVTIDEAPVPVEQGAGEMALRLSGALADLRGKDLADLRATAPPNPPVGDASDALRLCTIHLESGQERKRLAIFRKNDSYIAVELDAEQPIRAELRRDAFNEVYASWPQYRGGFEAAPSTNTSGKPEVLERPYTPGRFTLDEKTISTRLLGGATPKDEHPVRELKDEKLTIRVPGMYSPRNPAGLLVWVDAGPAGLPPSAYDRVLDELNFITIGAANSGNQRNLYSRIQLALDAAATASERYHIDPRRVYIYGISGGGRIASIAQVCFPEAFMGAVPIVGLSCYELVPNGLGQYYRNAYNRPGSAVFRLAQQRRMAPITGRRDGNQLEMTNATEIMQRHGLPVRLFDHESMGHELAKPEHFREALSWVDEPYQSSRRKEIEDAKRLLDAYTSKHEDRSPASPADRAALLKVMQAGPWTEPAWKAWGLLLATEPVPISGSMPQRPAAR
jgi:predicted esterase